MPDQDLNIKINTQADLSGIKQTTEGVKDVEKSTGSATKATAQWREAVKGLQQAFPGLAAVARLALNPISLSVAALSWSFTVLREKLKAAETDFRAASWGTEKANQGAEAYERMTKALTAAKDEAKSLSTELAAISTHYSNVAKLAQDNPLVAKQEADAKSRATSGRIAELRIQAQNIRRQAAAAAGGPSALDDKNTMAGLEPDAQRAAQEVARLDAEIERIRNATNPAASAADRFRQIPERIAIGIKYGGFTDPEAIINQLSSERGGWQGMIDRRDNFRTRMGVNDARRGFVSSANARASDLEAEARALESGRRRDDFNADVNFGMAQSARGVGVSVTRQGNGYSISPEAAQEIARLRAQAASLESGFASMTDLMMRLQKHIDRVQAQNKNRLE